MAIFRNKAFILALLIVAGLAIQFWTGSRYPALDQKAMTLLFTLGNYSVYSYMIVSMAISR